MYKAELQAGSSTLDIKKHVFYNKVKNIKQTTTSEQIQNRVSPTLFIDANM
jgi:hypothetical protein